MQALGAAETGVTNVADPLGGSWFVESLTDELEARAEAVFAHLDDLGDGSMLDGVVAGIESNWFQGEIADAAYRFQRKVSAGRTVVVGVNGFTGGNEDGTLPILSIGPEVEEAQRKRLAEVKLARSDTAVAAALARLADDAAVAEVNLMPAIFDAVRAYATVGEMIGTLAGVFGRWEETAVI